ncbi:hypothetical protein VTI74DRAFT_9196 [Chaetomium olivicolor]
MAPITTGSMVKPLVVLASMWNAEVQVTRQRLPPAHFVEPDSPPPISARIPQEPPPSETAVFVLITVEICQRSTGAASLVSGGPHGRLCL